MFTFTPRENWLNQCEDEWCHYVWYKCQFVMLYLAWDREINISLFFCDVFVWKWGPRPRTSSRCYHGNKSAATFKKGIFVHPPWVPNCMQNLKGGWKFSFPKMFDSYRDLFSCGTLKYIHLIQYVSLTWLNVNLILLMQQSE